MTPTAYRHEFREAKFDADRAEQYVRADQVREGDILCYGDRTEVVIERISVARCDGAIGLHGNNDTWSTWYQPQHHVRVKRGISLTRQ